MKPNDNNEATPYPFKPDGQPRLYTNGRDHMVILDERSGFRLATPAEITQAYADLARTTPPSEEEVGDSDICFCRSSFGNRWEQGFGISVRRFWESAPVCYTHWLPMPPKPRRGQDETE